MIHNLRHAVLKLPPPVKNIFKTIDYQSRLKTARWRGLPTFLIIGAQKSGTTSLYEYLVQHPSVVPARTKEVNFFDTAEYQQGGSNWYRAQFPLTFQRQIMTHLWPGSYHTGEATTYYLFHPEVPKRVFELVPQIKLIAILRNPIDRAFSHYHHERRQGREILSFEDALAQEEARLAAVSDEPNCFDGLVYRRYSYKMGGLYAEQLARWLDLFPRENLLVLPSEDMFTDMSAFLKEVTDFLELPAWTPKNPKRFNSGRYQSEISPATRRELEAYFEPHNQALYALLGRSFSW